jgi:hypothetical protein
MIFHYFGCKKSLYMYLLDICGKKLVSGVSAQYDKSETDFFKAIRRASEIKASLLKEYPDIMLFIESMFFENDPEVETEIKKLLRRRKGQYDASQFFGELDYTKFKDGVNPELVMKLLVYFSEGSVRAMPRGQPIDIELLMKDFDECLELFKNNFYK